MATRRTTRIVRSSLVALVSLGTAAGFSAVLTAGGQHTHAMPPRAMAMTGKAMMSKEQKITSAMTAAPSVVSAKATVLDWPAHDGEMPMVLRQGTNGWTCLPDMPGSEGNDPMCVDQPWMQWVEAYTTHTA